MSTRFIRLERRNLWHVGAVVFIATAGVSLGSCADPVHDNAVSALGPEQGSANEFHRAGQPCAVCHSNKGPAKTVFSVAGTVFYDNAPNSAQGLEGAQVSMVDATIPNNQTYIATTNCAGNFWVTPDQYNPAFPMKVTVYNKGAPTAMTTHISREPSCNYCHRDPVAVDSPGRVYIQNAGPKEPPPPAPDPACNQIITGNPVTQPVVGEP